LDFQRAQGEDARWGGEGFVDRHAEQFHEVELEIGRVFSKRVGEFFGRFEEAKNAWRYFRVCCPARG